MKSYVDANALVKMYLHLPGRAAAIGFLRRLPQAEVWPVPITSLLRFEVTNAIERMVFETRNGAALGVTPEAALLAQGDFTDDFKAGQRLRLHPLNLADIESEFESLARRHTAREGFRTYDVIHVASALTLRCARFLSFDDKANRLAKLVGLETL